MLFRSGTVEGNKEGNSGGKQGGKQWRETVEGNRGETEATEHDDDELIDSELLPRRYEDNTYNKIGRASCRERV